MGTKGKNAIEVTDSRFFHPEAVFASTNYAIEGKYDGSKRGKEREERK